MPNSNITECQNHIRVVFINPAAASVSYWSSIITRLPSYCEAYLFEHPGINNNLSVQRYGDSIQEYALHISKTLLSLQSKPLIIIGASYGGWIAQQIALLSDIKPFIKGLILFSTSDRLYPHGFEIMMRWQRILECQGIEDYLHEISVWSFSNNTFENHRYIVDFYSKQMTTACNDKNIYMAQLRQIESYITPPPLKNIHCDTLVLRGEYDIICPKFGAMALCDALPTSQYVEIPGVGHSVVFEQPQMATEHINGFVGALSCSKS